MVKSASIYRYRRKGHLYIAPLSRTTDGLWLTEEPCIVLDENCANHDLGDAVRTVLSVSRSGIPHPEDWRKVRDVVLETAGITSWTTFARAATCTGVKKEGRIVRFIPTVRVRSGGFEDLTDIVTTDGDSDADRLGVAARRAILKSEDAAYQ